MLFSVSIEWFGGLDLRDVIFVHCVMVPKKTTKQIGDEWEAKARAFLEGKDYVFVIQNYRSGRNEIDLICMANKTLVFVEVKYRKNSRFGNPEDFVDTAKLRRVMEAAENYIYESDWKGNIRFDVVAITGKSIDHFQDVG